MIELPDDVDEKILPIVKALNKDGFETSFSCQGGEGHMLDYPEVTIQVDEVEDLMTQFNMLTDWVMKNCTGLFVKVALENHVTKFVNGLYLTKGGIQSNDEITTEPRVYDTTLHLTLDSWALKAFAKKI